LFGCFIAMVDSTDSSCIELQAGRILQSKEILMTCHWLARFAIPGRATALAALLALGVASSAFAQTAAPAPDAPPPAPKAATPAPAKDKDKDNFGVEVTLTGKTIIYMKGNGNWDNALETLQDAFKSVYAYIDKQGLTRAGAPMTIYTEFDDTNFQFQAAVPITEAPKDPPKGDIAIGQTPTGKALRFAYKGSFHQMEDTIYNAIPEYLDEKQLDPSGTFIEEYQADPVTTPEDKFDIQIFVLLK
jgi:effector-binding domain-containing protein